MLYIRKRHDIDRRALPSLLRALASPSGPRSWPPDSLVTLSARSALDLFLQSVRLPPRSEVLVSAITILDVVQILEHHGLVPVPIDLCPNTLAPDLSQLRRAITPKTRALLVAHLFGGRLPMNPLIQIAREHGLLVLEDCAQSYDGRALDGDPRSDLRLHSFGPIKTATALGGALAIMTSPALRAQMRAIQSTYPAQPASTYLKRWLKTAALEGLAGPVQYSALVQLARRFSIDHDALLNRSVRSFVGADLLPRLRQQPSEALRSVLQVRLQTYHAARVTARASAAHWLDAQLAGAVERPGLGSLRHTHWIFPILSRSPPALISALRQRGFDATRGSSLVAVRAPDGFPPAARAERIMRHLVYLPAYPQIPTTALSRMAALIREVELR